MNRQHVLALLLTGLVILALAACGGPEEKRAKFFERAKEFYEKQDWVKARLEVKNALQIDPKFAEGYELLGRIEQKTGDLRASYGAFGKAVELNPGLLSAQVELGKLLLVSGAADRALEQAETVLAREARHPDALMLKAGVRLVKKDPSGAVQLLEGLSSDGFKTPEGYLMLATAYLQDLKPGQAEKTLQDGITANPQSVLLNLGLAKFYMDNGRTDQAEKVLQKVAELEPDKPQHKFNLANLYWESGRQAAAIDQITNLLEANPTSEDVREMAARFYSSKKQPFEAAKVLEAGIAKLPRSFKLRIQLAEVYLSQNRSDKAVETLEQCLTLSKDPADPGIIQAKNSLAHVHLLLRQPEKAEAYANEVIQVNPRSVDGHFNKGNIFLSRGDGPNAVAEFRTVVNERPQFIPGYVRLAAAHLFNKEVDLAVTTLQSALKVDPKSKEASLALARVYALKKDYALAEEQLRRAMDADPADTGAQSELGDFLAALKRYPEAEEAFRNLTQRSRQNPAGYIKLSRIKRLQGRDQDALRELEEGYRQNQTSAELLTELIQAYTQQKKHSAAVALCKKRIDDNPRDAFAYNLLGFIFTDMKSYPEAEAALKKAIEMQPLWPAPHTNLAKLYLAQGRKKEAVDKLNASIAANSRDAAAYLSLALLYERDRDYRNAMQVYESALRENPGFWFAANNLAFLLSEHGVSPEELARAKNLAESALRMRPNDPAVLDTLGWVLYRTGDLNQARILIDQALSSAPDADVLNYHMGSILTQLGRKDQARESLKKALEKGEDFPGRQEAERLLRELG